VWHCFDIDYKLIRYKPVYSTICLSSIVRNTLSSLDVRATYDRVCTPILIVYVPQFCRRTNFTVGPTQNGIVPVQSNADSIISENMEPATDPFVAELRKIHEMEDRPYDDIVERSDDLE
jgi:hypothetical protein